MGILVEKDEERSKLTERINADLRACDRENGLDDDDLDPENSAMLEGTKKTGKFSWFWVILGVLAILSLLVIFVLK